VASAVRVARARLITAVTAAIGSEGGVDDHGERDDHCGHSVRRRAGGRVCAIPGADGPAPAGHRRTITAPKSGREGKTDTLRDQGYFGCNFLSSGRPTVAISAGWPGLRPACAPLLAAFAPASIFLQTDCSIPEWACARPERHPYRQFRFDSCRPTFRVRPPRPIRAPRSLTRTLGASRPERTEPTMPGGRLLSVRLKQVPFLGRGNPISGLGRVSVAVVPRRGDENLTPAADYSQLGQYPDWPRARH
jgi:hypothetical protein